MKKFIFLFTISALFAACNQKSTDKTTVIDTKETADKKLEAITPDYSTAPQYISCKIDGQPYLATDNSGSITNINMKSQIVFASSAEQIKINSETKVSELNFTFFPLKEKGAGTYISPKDFYVQGHTDFPENGKLKYVSFVVKKDQQLIIKSYKDGLIEADFAFDVVEENDPAHVLKITDGHLKLQQTGK